MRGAVVPIPICPLFAGARRFPIPDERSDLLTGSESRKQAYLQGVATVAYRNASFSVLVRSPGSVALGLSSVLQYKGRILDEMSGSVARLRQSVKPADRELFEQLADRLKDNEAETERAATSIIESAPNESENHTAFADLRQKQNRWGEAIPHWEQVAKLRRLERTGLLKLAAAQIHEQRWDDARKSIDELGKTQWPGRFGNVQNETDQLRRQLPKSK